MSLSKKEKYNFYQILFLESVKSILRAKEYSKLRASLNRNDLKKIERNYNDIASSAAKYFVDKYAKGSNLELKEEQILESISMATLAFIGNGKK